MEIKICGIRSKEAAQVAVKHGATMIGFVFAPSTRRISVAHAKEIIATLPEDIEKVGVFVNESVENIHWIVKEAGLTMVQLHGEESSAYIQQLSCPVIKSFPINLLHKMHCDRDKVDYVLIDSPPTQFKGGSGIPFDWGILERKQPAFRPYLIAGGLTPENVYKAMTRTKCNGVDVSSGVETEGEKDPTKIIAFIKEAKRAEGEMNK